METNCECNTCSIRLNSGDLGRVPPASFMRFLLQVCDSAERQTLTREGFLIISPNWTWISCTGSIRSITWDALDGEASHSVRRSTNLSSVLELCRLYIGKRLDVIRAEGIEGRKWKTISLESVETTIQTLHEEELSIRRLAKLIRPIVVNVC